MDYEKLGAFYLGRPLDDPAGEPRREPFLYDAKDLTTHAVCVGMTGSGKTGLAISLIEEAVIDGIPIIAIDPKGDLGNLLLTFPELRPADFLPWVDPGEAARQGRTVEEQARWTADLWRDGLAEWDQAPERIRRFAESAERAIYTPGSTAGRPLSLLESFAPPAANVVADPDALRERITASVSGLLALIGIAADPLRSREHILLSTILDDAWRNGQQLDLPAIIHRVQTPPMARVGVMDVNTFFPAADRFALAMSLNGLIASPGFSAWSIGEPLDAGRLLYTEAGKPRLSIISIAHLNDAERMFLVTAVLNEVVAWMRAQPGSQSLRALLYMDEVFGYLPPTANPPSKIPMLTLLKQARAFGLGIVLATQNPVDLDYKALSNAGTWFLGRLQTERDKARVIEGLEGASAAAGKTFDRGATERTLAGLGNRVFLMNNVHEDQPSIFQTRWALSYLAGPLTRAQIASLAAPAAAEQPKAAVASQAAAGRTDVASARPVLDSKIAERFAVAVTAHDAGEKVVYRPALRAQATLHFSKTNVGVDEWRHLALRAPLDGSVVDPWSSAEVTGAALPELTSAPIPDAGFAPLPAAAADAAQYAKWARSLESHLYRTQAVRVLRCGDPKMISTGGEPEGQFRGRLRHRLREERDLEIEKLRASYAPKLARIQDRINRAVQKAEKQRDQYDHQKGQALISIGATVVGAIFGRKLLSSSTVGRAATAARGFGRVSREQGDVARAEEDLEAARAELQDMERELEDAIARLRAEVDPAAFALEEIDVRARKSDVTVESLLLVWEPWNVAANGSATPAFSG